MAEFEDTYEGWIKEQSIQSVGEWGDTIRQVSWDAMICFFSNWFEDCIA